MFNTIRTLKFKFQKKYFAFFALVPLLLVTALVVTPCPVCDGTGVISSTGMDKVSVIKTDFSLTSTRQVEGCLNYRVFTYDVVVSMLNGGVVEADGYVNVALIDSVTNRVLSSQLYQVYVPANTSATNAFTAIFSVSLDSPSNTAVQAEVVQLSIDCKVCSGTGKVALNYLPLAKALKKGILESQQIALTPYFAPVVQEGDMPEIEVGQENNIHY